MFATVVTCWIAEDTRDEFGATVLKTLSGAVLPKGEGRAPSPPSAKRSDAHRLSDFGQPGRSTGSKRAPLCEPRPRQPHDRSNPVPFPVSPRRHGCCLSPPRMARL